MPQKREIYLFYCKSNLEQIESFKEDLHGQDYAFVDVFCNKRWEDGKTGTLSQLTGKYVVCFISDNFFKNTYCMYRLMDDLKTISANNKMLPVLIDGVVSDEQLGEVQFYPTKVSKVGDIVKYMNYWQQRYLELRRVKRSIPQEESMELNAELKRVREISSGIADFFNYFKNLPKYTYEELKAGDYELFFRYSENMEAHLRYRKKHHKNIPLGQLKPKKTKFVKEQDETKTSEPSLEDLINASTDELLEENAQIREDALKKKLAKEQKSREMELELAANEQELANELAARIAAYEKKNTGKKEETIQPEEDEKDYRHQEDFFIMPSGFDDYQEEEEEEEVNDFETDINGQGEFVFQNDEDITGEFDFSGAEDETEEEGELEDFEFSLREEPYEEKEAEDVEINEEVVMNYKKMLVEVHRLIEEGETERGIALLRNSLNDDPENSVIRYFYAYYLARHVQDLSEASRQLGIILDQQPNNKNALFLLGELAEFHNDLFSARNYYEKVAVLDEDYPNIFFRLGKVAYHLFDGKKEHAAKYFKKAFKKDKKNAGAFYYYAKVTHELQGSPKKIIKALKKAIRLDAHNPDFLFLMATVLQEEGESALALKYYQAAVKYNPQLATESNDNFFHITETDPGWNNITATGKNKNADLSSFEKEIDILRAKIAALKADIAAGKSENKGFEEEVPVQTAEEHEDKFEKETKGIVYITGATSGIGKATAELFLKHDYPVLLMGRRMNRLKILQAVFREKYDAQVEIMEVDIRDKSMLKKALSGLDKKWQTPDILINNAGLAKGLAPIHEGKTGHWEEMIDTNIKGLLYMTRLVAPKMVKRRKGHIINISSIAGKEVYPNGNVYCATKHAVEALTKGMRIDLHKYNIRVSQISPGHVEDTEFALVRFDGDEEKAKIYDDFQPVKAADIAESIFFMATRPPHVNIQDIFIMGTQQANATLIDRSGRK